MIRITYWHSSLHMQGGNEMGQVQVGLITMANVCVPDHSLNQRAGVILLIGLKISNTCQPKR